jgi:hypothetical protein
VRVEEKQSRGEHMSADAGQRAIEREIVACTVRLELLPRRADGDQRDLDFRQELLDRRAMATARLDQLKNAGARENDARPGR